MSKLVTGKRYNTAGKTTGTAEVWVNMASDGSVGLSVGNVGGWQINVTLTREQWHELISVRPAGAT